MKQVDQLKRCVKSLLLALIYAGSLFAHQPPKESTLYGVITGTNGKAAAGVTLEISELRKSTSTNEQGEYRFRGLRPGRYTLVVRSTGIPNQSIPFIIKRGERVLQENIDLRHYSYTIDEIVVEGSNNSKIISKESVTSSRMPLSNMENPQVTNIISSELLKQQVNTDFASALTNALGGGVPVAFNQNRSVILSRGFTVQPRYVNGVSIFNQTAIDMVAIDRIEVLRGPSATLFGASDITYGGLINMITKKPYGHFGGEASYTMGSWNLQKITADINSPILKKDVLFRVNLSSHQENSFQDFGFQKSAAIAPALSYRVNDRLTVNLNAEYSKGSGTSPVRISPYTRGIASQNIANMGIPYKTSFANNNVKYNSEASRIYLQAQYKLSEGWISQSIISNSSSSFGGYTSQLIGRSDSTLRAQVTVGENSYSTSNIQQNFIGDFKINSFRHRMVVGIDYYSYLRNINSANVNTATINFKKPLTTYYNTFNTYYIDSALASATKRNQKLTQRTFAAYISNVTNFLPSLSIMYSLRVDHFRSDGVYNAITGTTSGNYNQTAFSPKFGIVYQPIVQKLSLFANYANGFQNQTGVDANGNSFKPEEAYQGEVGTKIDLLQNRLTGSISFYHIKVKNILREDPNDADYSIQDGTRISKGVDVDLSAELMPSWLLLVGYAYNDSKYTRMDSSLNGLRPASSGPKHLVNFWSSYELRGGTMKGLGVGVGGNYGSSSFQTKTSTAEVIIPSYFTLNATLFYKYKNTRFSLKFNNITDEKYWSIRLAPQKPFNVVSSFSLKI